MTDQGQPCGEKWHHPGEPCRYWWGDHHTCCLGGDYGHHGPHTCRCGVVMADWLAEVDDKVSR